MELRGIRQQLTALPLIKQLPGGMRTRAVMAFLAVGDPHKCRVGNKLFKENESSGDDGYVLLSGSVVIEKEEGVRLECYAPELLGEMQQFNPGHLRTATVTVAEIADVLRFSWESFFTIAADVFDEDEVVRLRDEISGLAWRHFISGEETVK